MWVRSVKILKSKEGKRKKQEDSLVIESHIALQHNQHPIVTFSCTYKHATELGLGYLWSHKQIHHPNQIEAADLDQNSLSITSKENHQPLSLDWNTNLSDLDIIQCLSYVQERVILYKDTAVTESAAICRGTEVVYFAEDIHHDNAIYKVLGMLFNQDQAQWDDLHLFTSGKIDAPLMKALVNTGIKLIMTRSGCTDKATDIAEENGTTLVGFARQKRYTIYTHPERII